jgi:hypothetical protein
MENSLLHSKYIQFKMIAQHILLATAVGAAVEMAAADVNRLRSHSEQHSHWFDKPTSHPTELHHFSSPYHYGNYGNNVENQHAHFYDWEDYYRDTPSWSYSPTSSPADGMVIPTSVPTPSPQRANNSISTSHPISASPTSSPTRTSSPSESWNVLTHEHFLDGFGVFQEVDSQDVHHYSYTLGRQGVVQLQKSSTLPSHAIAVDSTKLKVAFSFYANSMNVGEGFCLEYSLNDDADWNPVRCWQSSIDFENSKWNDDFNVELNLDDSIQVDSLRIKFESIAGRDHVDIMFDRITLLQLI